MVGNLPSSEVSWIPWVSPWAAMRSIVDDNGSELPINEEGNIAVGLHARPIGLFAGYIGDEERSRTSFSRFLLLYGDRV